MADLIAGTHPIVHLSLRTTRSAARVEPLWHDLRLCLSCSHVRICLSCRDSPALRREPCRKQALEVKFLLKVGIRSSQRAPTALTRLRCVRLCAGATSIDLRHEGLSIKFARVSRAVHETAITTPMLHLPAFEQRPYPRVLSRSLKLIKP